MQLLDSNIETQLRIQVSRSELVELARHESIISRMAAQNPGAYEHVWAETEVPDCMELLLPVSEGYRMAALPRSLEVDTALFTVVNNALLRRVRQ